MTAISTNTLPDPEIVVKLLQRRDFHAAIVQEAFRSDPPKDFGDHDTLARLYFTAATTIERLLAQNAAMQATLRSRAAQAVLDTSAFGDIVTTNILTLEPSSDADPDDVKVSTESWPRDMPLGKDPLAWDVVSRDISFGVESHSPIIGEPK